MPQLFISYRRDDAQGSTGRLFDRLIAHYGRDAVFMDVTDIPFGVNFLDYVLNTVRASRVAIAVIGDRWLRASSDGSRRLDDARDTVRAELEEALRRGIPILPVLLGRASMPVPQDLPPELAPLAFLNAIPIDVGRDFHRDVDRMIAALDGMLEAAPRRLANAGSNSAVAGARSPTKSIAALGSSSAVLSKFTQALCLETGRAILERGYALTVEERPGVAEHVLAGARTLLRERSLEEVGWLWRVPEFTVTGTGLSPNEPAPPFTFPSVLLLISGGRRTEHIAEAAGGANIAVVPIGITGGAAKNVWLGMRAVRSRAFDRMIPDSEFERLNRAAEPEVLAAIAVEIAARLADGRDPTANDRSRY